MSCKELFGVTHGGQFYKGIPPENVSESWLTSAKEIGFTGWADFSHLFFHPDGTLYGVLNNNFYKAPPPEGRMVESWIIEATLVGNKGWNSFQHLFFDPNGVLYGVTEDKLYKRDPPSNNQDKLIGAAGWSDFKFLFFDPKGILYAVENGNFHKRNPPKDRYDSWLGSSTLISPSRIGQRWNHYDHLFFMASGDLYGIFSDRLFRESPPSDWLANSLSMIGHSGWSTFKFLMSPMDRQ